MRSTNIGLFHDGNLALRAPIIFLVFNRPEHTARVFARIRDAKPSKLFVVADGPRVDRPDDRTKCAEVRRIVEEGIDWPCEVIRDYSEVNLGCARRVASGITNAFRQVEEAIILEDDCLPDPTFFRFCDELLDRFRENERVFVISGSNHQYRELSLRESYYFSIYNHCWGWATWRRAWQCFDLEMNHWPDFKESGELSSVLGGRKSVRFWEDEFDKAKRTVISTWDYAWTLSVWLRRGLSILPRNGLIKNVGFSSDATHTRQEPRWMKEFEPQPLSFPLVHPDGVTVNSEADIHTEKILFTRRRFSQRVIQWLRRGTH